MRAKTRSLLIGLGVAAVLAAGPAAFAATVSGPIGTTTLSQGDRGFPVRVLQGDLAQFGDYGGVVTGYFGPATAAALRKFQSAHGLTATGSMNAATFQAIKLALGLGGSTGGSGTPAASRGTSGNTGSHSTAGATTGGTTTGSHSTGGTTTGNGGGGKTFAQGQASPTITGGLQVGGKIDGLTITRVINLVATGYGATAADNYPYGATDAFGLPLKPGDVAVDPSVIALNTKMYVTGYKYGNLPQGGELAVARDTGGAIKGNRIDMYINSTNQSLINSFGIQHVTAYILGN
jgi:3D (Asp-Asp-Asp) domain-containing protein/peptidoglycan hydrolase-like protein with peptidoglycan-binding domain